jgi:drug/metabolite transporter (DMT)-like permease
MGSCALLSRKGGITAIGSAALICLWSDAPLLPARLVPGPSCLGHASADEIALLAIHRGVLMSRVAILAFNRAVSRPGSAAATAIVALRPAGASLLALPVAGRTPSCIDCRAIAIIVAGVLLASHRPDRAEPLRGQRRMP